MVTDLGTGTTVMMSLLHIEVLMATAQDYMYVFALKFWNTGCHSKYIVSKISRMVPG